MSKGLFIARLQPLHNGHMKFIEQILNEQDEIIIALGSVNEPYSFRNPFTLEERTSMVEESVHGKYTIISLNDFHDDGLWMEYVLQKIKDFDVVYTGNPLVKRLFTEQGYKVKEPENMSEISATMIRDMMYVGDKEWEKLVPSGTIKVIKKIKGVERIKKIYDKYYKSS